MFSFQIITYGSGGKLNTNNKQSSVRSRLDGQSPEEKAPPPLHAHLSEHTTTSDGILFSLGLEAEPQSTIFTL